MKDIDIYYEVAKNVFLKYKNKRVSINKKAKMGLQSVSEASRFLPQ